MTHRFHSDLGFFCPFSGLFLRMAGFSGITIVRKLYELEFIFDPGEFLLYDKVVDEVSFWPMLPCCVNRNRREGR